MSEHDFPCININVPLGSYTDCPVQGGIIKPALYMEEL